MRANEKDHRPPLNIAGAAEYCGCSSRHIQRMVTTRRIPYFKLGGTAVRFDPDTLDQWIAAQPKYEATQTAPAVRVTRPLAVKKVAKSARGSK
jgi:excisionase family DNA binding protein